MGKLEDFLNGVPLNDENAKLRSLYYDEDFVRTLKDNLPKANHGAKQLDNVPLEEFNDDDREWLRRLSGEPGWQILRRFVNTGIAQRERKAVLMSQQDPIGNAGNLVKEWAYVASMKDAVRLIFDRVDQEVLVLQQKQDGDEGEIDG
jgi:hypothetical protein